ncbi:MAG: Holliday junction resolvase RuvX, partial [Acidimicrobiia bacterium]
DYGSRRVGLAISDGLGLIAHPLAVVAAADAVSEIARLVAEEEVSTIVVGLPTGLGGTEGASAEGARALAEELGTLDGVDVVLLDERFTSRIAEQTLLDQGVKRRERRAIVDKVAASILLQEYLDNHR